MKIKHLKSRENKSKYLVKYIQFITLIPCGILILWQQVQLQALNQRLFQLEERLFDVVSLELILILLVLSF